MKARAAWLFALLGVASCAADGGDPAGAREGTTPGASSGAPGAVGIPGTPTTTNADGSVNGWDVALAGALTLRLRAYAPGTFRASYIQSTEASAATAASVEPFLRHDLVGVPFRVEHGALPQDGTTLRTGGARGAVMHIALDGALSFSDARGVTRLVSPAPGAFGLHEREHFAGLGHGFRGRVTSLDLAGQEITPSYGHDHGDQAPLYVPFFVSSERYGVFVNSAESPTFRFGAGTGRAYDVRAPRLDYFVMLGDTLSDVVDDYTALTGRPRLPPRALFGLALSDKGAPNDSSEAWWRAKIAAHRAAGFALDHVVNDNRWRAGKGERCDSSFAWDSTRYPDPRAYSDWAHGEGLVLTLDFNRCIAATSAGWSPSFNVPEDARIDHPESAPDLSRDDVRAWFWKTVRDNGLGGAGGFNGKRPLGDALWIDEFDEVSPVTDTTRVGNGAPWASVKNQFFGLAARALVEDGWNHDVGDAQRPYVWVRGGSAGGQRSASLWSGDIEATPAEMPLQIRGMLAAGLSGFPFWSHDAGGFLADQVPQGAYDAVYRTWAFPLASMTPIWKPHGMGPSRWPTDRSALSRTIAQRSTELRYRLLPYIDSLAHEAATRGTPLVRPLFWNAPTDDAAWKNDTAFTLGNALLVLPPRPPAPAPRVEGLARTLPGSASDAWFDFFSEERLAGGTTLGDESLAALPLYARGGAIVPMVEYAESTAFARRDALTVHVWSDGASSSAFELVEDDGLSERWSHGESATTPVTWDGAARRLRIEPTRGTYVGAPTTRAWRVMMHGLASAQCVRSTPSVASTTWEPRARGGVLVVTLPARSTTDAIELVLSACDDAPRAIRVEAEASTTVVSGGTRALKPRASGGGYVGGLDAAGSSVELAFTAPAAGTYAMSLSYSAGNGDGAARALFVDRVNAGEQWFSPLAQWNEFATTEPRTLALTAGPHTVRVTTVAAGQGAVDLDALLVTSVRNASAPFAFSAVSASNVVRIEAEEFHARVDRGAHTFAVVTVPRAYGGAGAVRAWPNTGAQSEDIASAPALEYRVTFPHAGRYYVWMRGHAYGNADDDSAHVALDRALAGGSRMQFANAARWTWTSTTMTGERAALDVSAAGEHVVSLVMREDGAVIDALQIADDASYTP